MRPDKFYHLLFSCLLGGMLLFPAGCSNDEYADVIDDSNEECIPIDVNFSGIQTLFGPYGEEVRNVQYNKIHETRDLDKSHMLETLVMAEPDTLRPPLTRATSALTNTTLRLVAYDNSGTYKGTGVYNIDGSGQVTSNEQLLLTKSGTYTFHCFSPALPVKVSGNTVTVDLPAAGGTTPPAPAFYYAKTGAVSVTIKPTGDNKITITVPTLTPQFCKLTLDVNHSSGIAISYSDAVLTGLYTGGTFTLPGGTVTSNTPVTTTTISSSNPTIYVYPCSVSNFSVTVHSLIVDGVNKGDVTSSTATTMSMTAGNAYKASVSITAPNYIKIAELPFKVARGNLLYNSTTGRWYMAPDQGYYCPKQDGGFETLTNNNSYGSSGDKVFSYFNWGVQAKSPNFSITSSGPYADAYGGTAPGTHYGDKFGYNSTSATSASTAVSNYKNNNDPCYAALGGNWHLPTGGSASSDIGYFTKATNTKGSFKTYTTKSNLSSGSTRTVYGHYFGTTGQPTAAQQDQYVFLPAAGYRSNVSPGAIRSEGSSGYGYYGSSTPDASDADRAYRLYFGSSNVDGGTVSGGRYYGFSLRCVCY